MRCRFYEWMISRALDSGARLPARHMRKCHSCRSFHRQAVQLERALREEAGASGLRRVRETAPPVRSRLPLAAGLAVAAAACIVVALLMAFKQDSVEIVAPPHDPAPAPVVASIPGPSLLSEAGGRIEPFADAASEPLLRQVRNTSETAVGAGRTLVFCLAIRLPDGEGKGK